jgi:hydrogenase maturation factor
MVHKPGDIIVINGKKHTVLYRFNGLRSVWMVFLTDDPRAGQFVIEVSDHAVDVQKNLRLIVTDCHVHSDDAAL